MGRYYIRQQEHRQWLCYLSEALEGYNRDLYLQLQEHCVDGIIPVTLREETTGRVFFYEIGEMVSLAHFIEKGLTEEKFLKLLIQILTQAVTMENQGIDTEVLLWNSYCIFVDQMTNRLGFLVDYSNRDKYHSTLADFLERLIREVQVHTEQFAVKQLILQYRKNSPTALLGERLSYVEELYDKFFGCKEYSGHLTLTSRLDEKGIHIDDFAQMARFQEKITGYTGDVCLIRARTKECIPIEKNYFYIGKEASAVDYCIIDNAAVSRSHACIVVMNSRYYIRDLGSTNRTYVNNLEVSGNQLQEIRPGYRITIANEVFYFQNYPQ